MKILNLAYNHFDFIPSNISVCKNLEVLNLSQNNITSIDGKNLRNLTLLKELNLSNNNLINWSSINKMTLNYTKNLEILDLSFNALYYATTLYLKSDSLSTFKLINCSITQINDEFFKGFPNLIYLDLSFNRLTEINQFPALTKLKVINLKSNKIYSIFYKAFIYLEGLNTLILNDNLELNYLNITTNYLKEIEASSCNIDRVDLNSCRNLTKLILNKNSISQTPSLTLTHLKYLDLSNNKISIIPENAFNELELLETLLLSYNTILSLTPSTFSTNFRLKLLNLSHNYFNKLIPFNSESLTVLDMSNCEIRSITSNCLIKMPFLKTLILSKNGISKLPNNFNSDSLNILDLTYCRIISVNNLTFASMPTLNTLYLTGNRLGSDVHRSYFHNITKLYLEDNAWRCDCRSENFKRFYEWLQTIQANTNKLICEFPDDTEGKTWIDACYRSWYSSNEKSNAFIYGLIVFGTMVMLFFIFITVKCSYRIKEERAEQRENERRAEAERRARIRSEYERSLAFQNAPDPRELQRPPSYTEALLMPRIDGSYTTLAGSRPSLNGSRKSLNNNTNTKDKRKRIKRRKRRTKSRSNESQQSSSIENVDETDSDPPRNVFTESSV